MILADLLPLVLPDAKGCADVVAESAIRRAARRLCFDAKLWREHQPAITAVAGQTAYAFTPAAGQTVVELFSLTVDGQGVGIVTPKAGARLDLCAAGDVYAYGRMGGFELRPARTGVPIVTFAAVAPTLAVAELPDALANTYGESIAVGALALLKGTADQPYGDARRALELEARFAAAIGAARAAAETGGVRVLRRTKPCHW